MVFVVDPITFGSEPFAWRDAREGTDDGDEIPASFGFDLEDGETGFLAEEGDALDKAGNSFDGLLVRAGRVRSRRTGARSGWVRSWVGSSVFDGGKVKRSSWERRSGFRRNSRK